MRFDLFYELSVPAFAGRGESQVFMESLEEIAHAETLGYRTAWLVEHHFMPEYSHSTAPGLVLAAASQRTSRIRLGHAILPLPYHHPIKVAEQIATLDLLSQGRVEFGFGRGFSPREYAAFDAAMGESRSVTAEALEVIRLAFTGQPVTHAGRHFQFEGLEVLPRVLQRPHPPLWQAAVSPESFTLAAELGVGALVGPFKPWFMVREDLRQYRAAWKTYHGDAPPAAGHNPRLAMTVGLYCHADPRHARREAKAPFEWFYGRLLGQTRPVLEQLYDGYEYYRRLGRFRGLMQKAVNLKLLDSLGMAIVGTPQHCVERLKALQREGVDHVLLAFGAGAMPTEQVRASMRLFAEEVMPEFAA
jgi:alkanesulfonate monooxygenase SsuD/methylene tetrahydromethanopterin reductase-like flavin-dependent oxidoreductase (luciferase family)